MGSFGWRRACSLNRPGGSFTCEDLSLSGSNYPGRVYKTRRGVERTLFNATIVTGILFLLLSLITVTID
jgi:hypothetical protein